MFENKVSVEDVIECIVNLDPLLKGIVVKHLQELILQEALVPTSSYFVYSINLSVEKETLTQELISIFRTYFD